MTVRLQPDTSPLDRYTDEVVRFQSSRQLRLRAAVPYELFTLCDMQNARYDDFAVKVSYGQPVWNGNNYTVYGYGPDYTNPGVGMGGNVLPAGYKRTDNGGSSTRFQLVNIRPAFYNLINGTNMTLTVRSSADPWLVYMEATRGSGSFGISKGTLNKAGSVMLILGLLGELGWLVPLIAAIVYFGRRRRSGAAGGFTPPVAGAVPGADPNQAFSPYAPAVYGVRPFNAGPSERDSLLSAQPRSNDPAAANAAGVNPFPPGYRYPAPYGQEAAAPAYPPPYLHAQVFPGAPGAAGGPGGGAVTPGGSVEMTQGVAHGAAAQSGVPQPHVYGYGHAAGYPPPAVGQQPQALYGYPYPPPAAGGTGAAQPPPSQQQPAGKPAQ
ncbi:hypothetical protein GPECTOR_16g757 [Gonium pectorale]|uniref:Uncharacterized protein n=1 Tax=Gonium pectorale TaxID=33097 RepID=A0A150GL93_GONPE|nr:hypothetical protein GPECTOR_16g757 [Gonium pectorale]|eukprot:KXZ50582.1 hypothetical protein GPECTOR_16g757 [Gonium pectorale]